MFKFWAEQNIKSSIKLSPILTIKREQLLIQVDTQKFQKPPPHREFKN